MPWLVAVGATVVVVVTFWAPGFLVLTAARIHGIDRIGLAPLITIGVLAPTALLTDVTPIRWCLATAAAATVITALAAWLLSRGAALGARTSADRPGLIIGAVALGAMAQLIPIALGMGQPGRLLTAHDAVTHANAVAWMSRSGRASSFAFWDMEPEPGGPTGFYAAGWHAVAALIPGWPDAATTFNLAALVPTALTWTLGLTLLTRALVPARSRVWIWAALLSAAGIAMPVLIVMRPEGMIPNAFALAMIPGFVAGHVRPPGGATRVTWLLALLAYAGLALTHPNALLSAGLVLLPWAAPRLRRALPTAIRSAGGRVVLFLTLVLIGTVAVLLRGAWANTVAWPAEGPLGPWHALLMLVSGNATGMGAAGGLLVVAAGAAGAVLLWGLGGGRWFVVATALVMVFYLLATSSIPVLTEVDRPWYGEPRRFAPVLAMVVVPLAALALDSVPRWLLTTGRVRTRLPRAAVATGLVVGVIAVSTLAGATGLWALTRYTFVGSGADEPALADDEELAMLHRLGSRLEPGTVLGSAYSGAAHLYALHGQPVVPRAAFDPEPGSDLEYVTGHLDGLGTDLHLCQALERMGVRYLYVDPRPWDVVAGQVDVGSVPAEGVRLVDSGGTAGVYEIAGCDDEL